MFDTLHFQNAVILFALFVIPLYFFLRQYFQKRRIELLKAFGDFSSFQKLSYLHSAKHHAAQILFFISLALIIISYARPQWGEHAEMIRNQGIDVVIALDVSKSMLAQDIAPNRLTRAKLMISDLTERFHGSRIGIIVFAGDAFVQCPLTNDYAALRLFLQSINTDAIAQGGTAIAQAISLSLQMFQRNPTQVKSKILLLISDGETHDENAVAEAKKSKEAGISIYSLGIGSKTGEPIPILDENENMQGYLKDESGNTVMSRLNESLLQEIAETSSGKYYHASADNSSLTLLVSDLEQFEKSELGSMTHVVRYERYQIFTLLAFIFLVLSILIKKISQRIEI